MSLRCKEDGKGKRNDSIKKLTFEMIQGGVGHKEIGQKRSHGKGHNKKSGHEQRPGNRSQENRSAEEIQNRSKGEGEDAEEVAGGGGGRRAA